MKTILLLSVLCLFASNILAEEPSEECVKDLIAAQFAWTGYSLEVVELDRTGLLLDQERLYRGTKYDYVIKDVVRKTSYNGSIIATSFTTNGKEGCRLPLEAVFDEDDVFNLKNAAGNVVFSRCGTRPHAY